MLHQTIREKMIEAMRAKNEIRLLTYRGLLAACTNELVAKKRKPDEVMTDEEVTAVIQRGVKQRKDSIEQFTKGNRPDLVANEEAEMKILQEFLPEMMSKDDIKVVVLKKKEELQISDPAKIGMFMGAVMKELKGKANGEDVKEIIETLFKA
ncbi:MAG: GatB/YqeY domain-containing protein [Patescibacteria group bacterium]